MDPISLTLGVVNVLAVIDNLYRGIQFLRRASEDPKVDGLFVRLITEKARYAEWKRRMAIETAEDLEILLSKLPDDARRTLPMILAPMQKYNDLSERLFKKYGISPPNVTNTARTFKDKVRRVDLLIDGQRQLDQVLDTLKSCNDGLLTIAPPAPGYYVSLAGNDQILETSDELQHPILDASQREQLSSDTSQDATSLVNGRRAGLTSHNDGAQSNLQGSTRRVFRPMIELLHSTCLRVMRLIEKQYPDHKTAFRAIGDRLAIWGSGLFNGQVTLDQALNPKSTARKLLRKNIAGTLADTAVILRHVCSILGEPDNSAPVLQLREIFAFPEISVLPLNSISLESDREDAHEDVPSLEAWLKELAGLAECLFPPLSAIEMVMKETIAQQRQNSAMDERELVLIKSESNTSLPSLQPASAKTLLKIDLQLITAMQNSLKDSKFAKYMEHKNLKLSPAQLCEDLDKAGRQMKYWAGQLGASSEGRMITAETQEAMMLNLTRIARTFEARMKSAETGESLSEETKAILDQCLKEFPGLEEAFTSPMPESNNFEPLDVLKSSNLELRKLVRSRAPDKNFMKDFAFDEKKKLADADATPSLQSVGT